jgi:hypothetical protein
MSNIQRATTEDSNIYLTEETEISESVTTSMTTLVTTTNPSGNQEIDVQTVTITITSTQE